MLGEQDEPQRNHSRVWLGHGFSGLQRRLSGTRASRTFGKGGDLVIAVRPARATSDSGERSQQTGCHNCTSRQNEEALLHMRHQGEPQ